MPSEAIRTHIPCPLCGSHDAGAMYSDGHFYCFSCQGYIGNSEGANKSMPKELLAPDELEFKPLQARKITLETCQKYGYAIAHDGYSTWQVAPYYNHEGELVGQHLRGKDKVFKWCGKPNNLQLFGQHLFKGSSKQVVVTEGEIDCLSVSQAQGNRWPVVSLPNGASCAAKAFKDNLEWLESFEKVIICFDMDEP